MNKSLQLSLTALQNKAFKTIELSKVALIVWTLQTFRNMKPYEEKHQRFRNLPVGCIGRAVADLLDEHQMKLIPGFESHDLKHLILGYGMTTRDELKMQAYLLGNGNRTLPCLLFLTLGILTPAIWKELYQEYQKGKKGKNILKLQLDECANEPIAKLIQQYRYV